ncbi:PhzF family phenazine biosynthesis protein [Alkalihalobacillus pseudalcaliphilus]|uniref:PhzF family phenazine biosynthesis protein n=1 Tax=Alkalihalobacillus pseudalcaliphilus TaxID=79884 RepID=UPI00064DF455|nr:PhzF family phenazine biosynthesis protein [Alkalihalobacillus pseudalcaliphilus]KMK75494.1 isomerase [Alkalihalobacillus pseudalcaliphilus]
MQSVTVYHYDAFSLQPNEGNPAGIVLEADHLSDQTMQEIAFKIGFNETAFHLSSKKADLRLRYFTPGHEMNLCGHATVATLYALKSRGLLGDKSELTIETNAGILPIQIEEKNDDYFITLKHAAPQFREFIGSPEELTKSIGLKPKDISEDLPIMYGSTGTWTLLVPIRSLSSFSKMKPNNQAFPSIFKEIPNASLHAFCMETFDQEADMHARHFSSPYSGTIEDAVTGTASGVMAAYYQKFMNPNKKEAIKLVIEQGYEIGKNGRVYVSATPDTHGDVTIKMSGQAVYVNTFEIKLIEKIK